MATIMFADNRKEKKNQDDQPAVVHYVPFKVEYDGNANVGTKFSSKTVEKVEDSAENKVDVVFENQFRGKPLMGKRLDLPEDYEGIVCTDFRKSSSLNSDIKENSTTSLIKGFTSMTYWNWDKPPSGMDTPAQLLDWLDISKVLHEPIDFEEEPQN